MWQDEGLSRAMILADVSSMERNKQTVLSKKTTVADGMICCGHSLVNSMLAENQWVVVSDNDGVLKPAASSHGFILCSNSSKSGSNGDTASK